MKKDYSEFQYSASDRYRAVRSNTPSFVLDNFRNTVSISDERKKMYFRVDDGYEFETLRDILDEYEQEKASRGEPHYEKPPESEEDRLAVKEAREKNILLMQEFQQRYPGKIRFGFEEDDSPESDKEPLINILSGAWICLGYGEGILDFLYADFDTPLQGEAAFWKAMQRAFQKETETFKPEETVEKVYSHAQITSEEFYDYMDTFSMVEDAAYRSLYTAICPPVFLDRKAMADLVLRYRRYLLALQQEYREIMEFCYDEDFYPEVLGNMMPHERYYLYRIVHSRPSSSERTEEFRISHNLMGRSPNNIRMPYSMEHDELQERMNSIGHHPITEKEKELAEKLQLEPKQLHVLIWAPCFISVQYVFQTVDQILELEFTKMLEQNVRFRKCKRCGRYFIMKGNYDTVYCDRIAEGETRTCQQIAAQENYKARIAENQAIPIYNKYYKRYAARVKVNQIKEQDFKIWKYQAILKRDECTDEKITPEELTEWMEAAFPNRKPRVQKEKE